MGKHDKSNRLVPELNKFHQGAAGDGKHYWLTPPDLYASLDAEFHFDFDPAPYPQNGVDGLTCKWGNSNYVNPPFGSILHNGKKKGMTAWVRKALEEHAKGKRVVMVYPLDKWVLMLLAAGAQVRNLGDVRWRSIEDGQPGPGTGRHIACFVLDHPQWLRQTRPTAPSSGRPEAPSYTKEPWEVDDTLLGFPVIRAGTYEIVAEPNKALDEWPANARRIVACVNALAGIPTEILEQGAIIKELLAAAQTALGCMDIEMQLSGGSKAWRHPAKLLRDVIAKVTGDTPSVAGGSGEYVFAPDPEWCQTSRAYLTGRFEQRPKPVAVRNATGDTPKT